VRVHSNQEDLSPSWEFYLQTEKMCNKSVLAFFFTVYTQCGLPTPS